MADEPKSFVLTFGSCSRIAYDTQTYARMQARDPIAFIHLGDWLYPDYTGADASRWINEITAAFGDPRSEEHTSELQSRGHLVCRLLLEKKKKKRILV